jgi:hypothetical protein
MYGVPAFFRLLVLNLPKVQVLLHVTVTPLHWIEDSSSKGLSEIAPGAV